MTDGVSGASRRYLNAPDNFASIGDVLSFDDPTRATTAISSQDSGKLVAVTHGSENVGPCKSGPQFLCLNDGRFAVSVSWTDFRDGAGSGTAVRLENDTGHSGSLVLRTSS